MSTYRSLAPVFYVSFFFGLLGPWWSSKSRVARGLHMLLVLANLFCLCSYLYFGHNLDVPYGRDLSVHLKFFVSWFYSVVEIAVLLMCLWSHKSVQGIFEALEQVDCLLVQVNIQMNYSRIRWINWAIMGCLFGLNLLQVGFTFAIYPVKMVLSPVVLFRLFYKQFYHQSYVVLLVTVTTSVLHRVAALNEGMTLTCQRRFLESNYDANRIMCLTGVVRRPTRETIRRLGEIHQRLLGLLEAIGSSFGVQTLCYVSLYLCLTLLTMYQAMDEQEKLFKRLHSMRHDVPPLIKSLTFFTTMTIVCTRIKRQVRRGGVDGRRISD